jgi:flagellar basal-body rod protein FlgB
MPVNGLFGTTIDLLGKSLDMRIKNQTLIAGNLANAETPGYNPVELSFENELKQAMNGKGAGNISMAATNPRHFSFHRDNDAIGDIQGRIVDISDGTPGKDGNSVELETEMGRMAENQVLYNASVQILTVKFDELKNAVQGGS